MSRVDYGQIDVDLGGEIYTLKPTLNAMQKIERQFGGLRSAMQQVQAMSLEALVFIVAAGAGVGQRQTQALAEQVFEAGIVNVIRPVSEYLACLLDPSGRGESEGSDEGKA